MKITKYILLSLALFGSRLSAATLPNDAIPEIVSDVSGGLNTASPSHKIDLKYSPYMRNVFVDDDMINRINGFRTIGSSRTLQRVTGIFPYIQEDGTTRFLVTDSSLTLQTSDFTSWVFVSSGSNPSTLLNWIQVRNKMWGFNGVDSVITWDNTTKTILDGTKGTPSVPKFKYAAYYQDRVWGFNFPSAASDLAFTSVVTTDAIIIAPDDSRAWPVINLMHIGQGDGQIGTALWVYQGQLRSGKERSVYTIYGDNPSNYFPRKEETSIGIVSNDSVVIHDGQTHFLSQDGVYRNVTRISDLIEPDIAAINKGATNIVTNIWETFNDFNRGQFHGSTVTPDGLVTISTSEQKANYYANGAPDANDGGCPPFTQFLELGTTQGIMSTPFAVRTPTETIPSAFLGYPTAINICARFVGPDSAIPQTQFHLQVKNMGTGRTSNSNQNTPNATSFNTRQFSFGDAVPFTSYELQNSSLAISVVLDADPSPYVFQFFPTTSTGYSSIRLLPATTVQYLSDVSTITNSITAWGNFDSLNNTNGGLINYYYRTSTSSVNISTQIWTPISAGGIINAPLINNYIQWASTISSVNTGILNASNIDNISISHIEGQSSFARPFGISWKNRYWLAVTTTTDNTRRLIYVKAKSSSKTPDAWMPIEGIPIACFAKSGSSFYGGSASTGSVYRMDYGTNFDGAMFQSIYDTPDMPLGNVFLDKSLLKYVVEGEKSMNGTLTVSSSFNQGPFSDRVISIDGSGRYSKIIEGISRDVKTIRLRFSNSQIDTNFTINSYMVIYNPTKALSNK